MNPENSATDRELDQFYGTPPTEAQVQEAIRRFTESYDAYDLSEACFANQNEILSAMQTKKLETIGQILDLTRRCEIANLASIELYGKRGVITAKDIK